MVAMPLPAMASAVAGLVCLAALPAVAAPPAPDVQALLTPALMEDIRGMLSAPVITLSVTAQNERRAGIDQRGIEKLDAEWKAQRDADDQPLIAATLSSPSSAYLTQVQAGSGGLYAALFVMDANGLNVGQSAVTSDYWQGDEDKFTQTFPKGPDAVHLDAPEFNEDLKVWLVQLNLTLAENGKPIGTATVELNATELARRAGVAY